jgi:hypothetical protein
MWNTPSPLTEQILYLLEKVRTVAASSNGRTIVPETTVYSSLMLWVWLGGVNFSGLQAESSDAKSNNNLTKHKSKLLIKKRGKKWRGMQKGERNE